MSSISIITVLVLGLISFNLPTEARVTAEPTAKTWAVTDSFTVSGSGNSSFSGNATISVNIHLGFNYDLSWFLNPLQAVLKAYSGLFKILASIVDARFKAAVELFVGSIHAAFAIFQNVTVYSLHELYELIGKFYAQLIITIKHGNDLLAQLVKGFSFVASAELKILLSLLDGLRIAIEVFLRTKVSHSVDLTIKFHTELGEKFSKNLTATFNEWAHLVTSLNSAVNNKTNVSIAEFEATVNAAILLVANVTVTNSTELLKVLFTFGNQLGIVYVKFDALYQLLIDARFTSAAAHLKTFHNHVSHLLHFAINFIASLTRTGNEKPTDLKFTITFSKALEKSMETSFEAIYAFYLDIKGIISYIGTSKFSANITRFEESIDIIINQVKGKTIKKKQDLLALLINIQSQLKVSIENVQALVTGYITDGLYVLNDLFYQFSIILKATLDLAGKYIEKNGGHISVTPINPTSPGTSDTKTDVGLVFGFNFKFQVDLVLTLNTAYKQYLVWKEAVTSAIDMPELKKPLLAFQGTIYAAFAILIGKEIKSYDVLVKLLVTFFAKVSVAIRERTELRTKLLQANQTVLVTAFTVFFTSLEDLSTSVSKLVPEVGSTVTPITATSAPGTSLRLDIKFNFESKTEFVAKIESSFNEVIGWDGQELNSIGGKFISKIRRWIKRVIASFGVFKGKTISNLKALHVAIEAFITRLNAQIKSGKTLHQRIKNGDGSVVLISKFTGYVDYLVNLQVYIKEFEANIHDHATTSTDIAVTTSESPDVKLTFGFGFKLKAELLLILNEAVKAYFVWKEAVATVVDVIFKNAIEALQVKINAAFTLLETTVSSYEFLVELLSKFLAQISIIVKTGQELETKFQHAQPLAVVSAFKVCFSVFGKLYLSITKLIPEIVTTSSTHDIVSTTPSHGGTLQFVIAIDFEGKTEFVTRIEGSFGKVIGWVEEVKSISGSFLVQIEAWFKLVVAVFDVFEGKTFPDLNVLDVAIEKFIANLKIEIKSGKKLIQQIKGGDGSTQLIRKIKAYVAFLVKLQVYVSGFKGKAHGSVRTTTGTAATSSSELGFAINIVGFKLKTVIETLLNGAYAAFSTLKLAIEHSVTATLKVEFEALLEMIVKLFAIVKGQVVDTIDGLYILLVKFSAQLKLVIKSAIKFAENMVTDGLGSLSGEVKIFIEILVKLSTSIIGYLEQLGHSTTSDLTTPSFTDREPTDGEIETGETETEPTDGETETEPTDGETETEPTDGETETEPTDGEIETGETETESTDGETETEPTDGEIETGETETESTDGETETEPTDGEIETGETETESTDGETEIEPTNRNTESEPTESSFTDVFTGSLTTGSTVSIPDLHFHINVTDITFGKAIIVAIEGLYEAYFTLKLAIQPIAEGAYKLEIHAFYTLIEKLFAIVQGKDIGSIDALIVFLGNFSAQLKLVIEEVTKFSGSMNGQVFIFQSKVNVFLSACIKLSTSIKQYIEMLSHSTTHNSIITTEGHDKHFTFIIKFKVEGSAEFVDKITTSFQEFETLEETLTSLDVGDFEEHVYNWIEIVVELFYILDGKTANNLQELIELVEEFKTKFEKTINSGLTLLNGIKDNGGSKELAEAISGFIEILVQLQTSVSDFYKEISKSDITTETVIFSSLTPGGNQIVIHIPGAEVMVGALNGALQAFFTFKTSVHLVAGGLGKFVGQVTNFVDVVAKLFAIIQGTTIDTTEVLVSLLIKFAVQLKVVITTATKLQKDLIAGGFVAAGESFEIFLAVLVKLTTTVNFFITEHSVTGTGTLATTEVTPISGNTLNFEIDIDSELDKQLAFYFEAIYKFYVTYETKLSSSTEVQQFQGNLKTFLASVNVVFGSLKDVTIDSEENLKSLLEKVSGELTTAVTNGQTLFTDLWDEKSYDVAFGIKLFLTYLDGSLKLIVNVDSDATECKCV